MITRLSPQPPRIDLFKAATWEKGQLEKTLDLALALPEDTFAAGQWRPVGYAPGDRAAYYRTLGGKPLASYDPQGFLLSLGLSPEVKAPGRESRDLVAAYRLTDYKPDPKYFPAPKWLAGPLQSGLLALARLAPGAMDKIDQLATRTVIRQMEKADREDPHPFGQSGDIQAEAGSGLSPRQHYWNIYRQQQAGQLAWDEGVHTGSITPDAAKGEGFGTYDIARRLGFTDRQARQIAEEDFDVDTNETHYSQNGKPRITHSGTGGAHGDFHWHFNRSPAGQEDSRITAARTHLERAVTLARSGQYPAAERELGIGLHSLQDMFAHGQITPANHTLLGEFPDFVKWNPVGMYETALATEGYLKRYLAALDPGPAPAPTGPWRAGTLLTRPAGVSEQKWPMIQALVTGDAPLDRQQQLARQLDQYPAGLLELLHKQQVTVFLSQSTRPTQLGFGQDLNGDGQVTPGRWTDVNQDGERQDLEREDGRAGGGSWDEIPAAYHDGRRMIYIGAEADPPALQHEITHAVDMALERDRQLGGKWRAYRDKLYQSARRSGALAFDASDPCEHFAGTAKRETSVSAMGRLTQAVPARQP